MEKYKYKDIEVKAETKEEAIHEIISMALEKKEVEDTIKNQSDNIIIWWCLCDYFYKYEDPNELLHHEQIKLKGLIRKINEMKVKKLDSKDIKRKFLHHWWIDGWEYTKRPSILIDVFEGKFDDEKINYNRKKYMEVAKDFANEIPELIDLMTSKSTNDISRYVINRFKKNKLFN